MSGPRVPPRSYSTEPEAFGKAEIIAWIDASSSAEVDRIEAAKLQHAYAVRIKRRIHAQNMTVHDYAVMTGRPYDRLTKILRGDATMTLRDVAQAERVLKGIVTGETPSRSIPRETLD